MLTSIACRRTKGLDLEFYGSRRQRRPWQVRQRALDALKTLTSTFGLDILLPILAACRIIPPLPLREQKKVAVSKRRTHAVIRSLVHILPLAGAVAITSINLTGLYVGPASDGMPGLQEGPSPWPWLQFAAKVHELLMVASLAAILASYVRFELALSCTGLPFGAIFAPGRVAQPQYLWSIEFWGALTSRDFSGWRRLRLGLAVIPLLLLAAMLGPASAIAMMPRREYWPAGRTNVYLNMTAAQVFPSRIEAAAIDPACVNVTMLGTAASTGAAVSGCPLGGAGWLGLVQERMLEGRSLLRLSQRDVNGGGPDGGDAVAMMALRGATSTRTVYHRTLRWETTEPFIQRHEAAMFTTQQAVLADALAVLGGTWQAAAETVRQGRTTLTTTTTSSDNGSNRPQRAVHHMPSTQQPYATLVCNDGYAATHRNDTDVDETAPIEFLLAGNRRANATMLPSKRSLYDTTTGIRTEPRFAFVDLNDAAFRDVSVGLIVLVPGNVTTVGTATSVTQHMLPCVVYAGWARSEMSLSTTGPGDISEPGIENADGSGPAGGGEYMRVTGTAFPGDLGQWTPGDDAAVTGTAATGGLPFTPVRISAAWAKFVVPLVAEYGTALPNVLASAGIRQPLQGSQPQGAGPAVLSAPRFAADAQTIVPMLLAIALSNLGPQSSAGVASSIVGVTDTGVVAKAMADPRAVLRNEDIFLPMLANTSTTASPSSAQVTSALQGGMTFMSPAVMANSNLYRTPITTRRLGEGYGLLTTSASTLRLGGAFPAAPASHIFALLLLGLYSVIAFTALLLTFLRVLLSLCNHSRPTSGSFLSHSTIFPDLVSLAVNSRPTAELQDACAGPRCMATYGKRVRVIATRRGPASGGILAADGRQTVRRVPYTTSSHGIVSGAAPRDHLELVFAGDEGLVYYGDVRGDRVGVVPGTEYGRWSGEMGSQDESMCLLDDIDREMI